MPATALSRSDAGTAVWGVSEDLYTLADSDRSLGNVILEGTHWLAFDTVHMNPERTCFSFVGCFKSLTDARRAVEKSVGVSGDYWHCA